MSSVTIPPNTSSPFVDAAYPSDVSMTDLRSTSTSSAALSATYVGAGQSGWDRLVGAYSAENNAIRCIVINTSAGSLSTSSNSRFHLRIIK